MHATSRQDGGGGAPDGVRPGEGKIGHDDGHRVVNVVTIKESHVVVVGRDKSRVPGKGRHADSHVDSILITLNDKGQDGRRALCNVTEGALTRSTVGGCGSTDRSKQGSIIGTMNFPPARIGNKVGKGPRGGHGGRIAQLWTHRFKNYLTDPVWFVQRQDL